MAGKATQFIRWVKRSLNKNRTFNDDIVITLGKASTADINFNVSRFLRVHGSSSNVDKFIRILDAKVHIDPNDSKYSHIYQGIYTIVKRVVAELGKLDPFFADAKLRKTGSSISGVKVGLPHEADYVMELPRGKRLRSGKSFSRCTLFPLVQRIVAGQAATLTEGLAHWVIHGVKEHSRIGGVCLVMQCCAIANDSTSKDVGVTVDVVPVYVMKTTHDLMNENAKAFLSHDFEEYTKKGELHRLVGKNHFDTGFIENNIMKQLPEDTKRAYRVAKFLNTHLCESLSLRYVSFDDIQILDEKTRLRLYGEETQMPSYHLRVLFLHLLLHVHGTEAEQRLKGGLLVLCLLEMLMQWVDARPYNCKVLYHPLTQGVACKRDNSLDDISPIRYVIRRLMRYDNPGHLVKKFNLVKNTRFKIKRLFDGNSSYLDNCRMMYDFS